MLKNYLVSFVCLFLPHAFRRWMLSSMLGFELHPTAHVGRSIYCCRHLRLEAYAQIGSLNFIRGLTAMHLCEHAWLGNLNWITSMASGRSADNRFLIERHAAVTNRHYIDCQRNLTIGEFTTIAGVRSTILTHQIDLLRNIQTVGDISIGRYCMIGSNCIILPGTEVSDFVVFGAGSLIRGENYFPYHLYGGVPARELKKLPKDAGYFVRTTGYVSPTPSPK